MGVVCKARHLTLKRTVALEPEGVRGGLQEQVKSW
jgi:hypothetical protein